jgi:hypothetical protein
MQDFCEPEVESGYAEKEEGEWESDQKENVSTVRRALPV